MTEQSFSEGPSAYYRAYRIGRGDRVEANFQIEAASDEEAVGKARAIVDGAVIELWDRGRFIARIEPERPDEAPYAKYR